MKYSNNIIGLGILSLLGIFSFTSCQPPKEFRNESQYPTTQQNRQPSPLYQGGNQRGDLQPTNQGLTTALQIMGPILQSLSAEQNQGNKNVAQGEPVIIHQPSPQVVVEPPVTFVIVRKTPKITQTPMLETEHPTPAPRIRNEEPNEGLEKESGDVRPSSTTPASLPREENQQTALSCTEKLSMNFFELDLSWVERERNEFNKETEKAKKKVSEQSSSAPSAITGQSERESCNRKKELREIKELLYVVESIMAASIAGPAITDKDNFYFEGMLSNLDVVFKGKMEFVRPLFFGDKACDPTQPMETISTCLSSKKGEMNAEATGGIGFIYEKIERYNNNCLSGIAENKKSKFLLQLPIVNYSPTQYNDFESLQTIIVEKVCHAMVTRFNDYEKTLEKMLALLDDPLQKEAFGKLDVKTNNGKVQLVNMLSRYIFKKEYHHKIVDHVLNRKPSGCLTTAASIDDVKSCIQCVNDKEKFLARDILIEKCSATYKQVVIDE